MTYYYPQSDNFRLNSNFLMGNNFQLHLELEKLRSENNNLKNTINQQVSQIQQQASIENKIVSLKKDLITMNCDYKNNFDKKINEIKNEQHLGIKLITEIWKLNKYLAIVNLQKPLNNEKCTQTDFESDNEDDDVDSLNETTKIIFPNDYYQQKEIVPETDEISDEISDECDDDEHEIEMETQTEEISNDNHQINPQFEDQTKMETQLVEIFNNNCLQLQTKNNTNEFLQTKMETQPEENLRNHLTSLNIPRLQKNSNDYTQTQVTICENVLNLSTLRKNEKEISVYNKNEELKNEQRERIMIKMFSCESCERKYVSKQKLKIHKKMIHQMKQCNHCQKTFKLSYINRHQKFFCKEALNFFSYERSITR